MFFNRYGLLLIAASDFYAEVDFVCFGDRTRDLSRKSCAFNQVSYHSWIDADVDQLVAVSYVPIWIPLIEL